MPATENDRRNLQQPTLDNPSMPDHDRRNDEGMHAAIPDESREQEQLNVDSDLTDDADITAPDQEFGQILESGTTANGGRIPEDPNNWLTSDPGPGLGAQDMDPEDRGESLVDDLQGDKH
jgi:hypothetical protein